MRYLKLSFVVLCLLVGVACAKSPEGTPVTGQIRITFEIEGRKYEAVSFLRSGEEWVSGDEMVRRTGTENGGGLGEEEGDFLWDHLAEWPEELKRHTLVFTKWRLASRPRFLRYFDWRTDVWYPYWHDPDGRWIDHVLVLRRLS